MELLRTAELRLSHATHRRHGDGVVDLALEVPDVAKCITHARKGGARIVEKPFTLNRALKGTDHRFSLEPQGLRKLVRDLKRTRKALGDGTKTMYQSEVEPVRKMAKALVAARDLHGVGEERELGAGEVQLPHLVEAVDDLALPAGADEIGESVCCLGQSEGVNECGKFVTNSRQGAKDASEA